MHSLCSLNYADLIVCRILPPAHHRHSHHHHHQLAEGVDSTQETTI